MRKPTLLFPLLAVAACLAPPVTSRADIIVLTNGKTMKGIVRDADSPNELVFIGVHGRLTMRRSRVKEIKKESPGMGYVHIGDEFMARSEFTDALASYRSGLDAEPDLALARERIKAVEEAIDERESNRRRDQIQSIEDVMSQVQAAITEGSFETAESMIEQADELVPTPSQSESLRGLVGDLYLRWAEFHLDRLNKPAAEEKLNLALAADANNEQVITYLLQLWEDQPGKKERILQIYETVLERKPEDMVLRRKVADLHYELGHLEESVSIYLKIYESSDRFRSTTLEARIVEVLGRLHRQFAMNQDFEQAIAFYRMHESMGGEENPQLLALYEYLNHARSVDGAGLEGRLELAAFAEERRLDERALRDYRRALELVPDNQAALDALNRYALDLIGQAQNQYEHADYYLAKTLAERARREFPESREAALRSAEIVSLSQTEIVRDKREKRELSREYIKRGDEFFSRGEQFYRRITDTQQIVSSPVASDKSEAIRNFQYAIDAYETAKQLDPSLASEAGSLVDVQITESRRRLRQLQAPAPQVGFSARNLSGSFR